MNPEQLLVEQINRSEVRREILGEHRGGLASISITRVSNNGDEPAITVRIEGQDRGNIPREITLDGHTFPILVTENFKLPTPY